MRVARVELENFRCHQRLMVDLQDVTAFIGQNGSGKSTVLEGIQSCIDGRPLRDEDRCIEAIESEAVRVAIKLVDLAELDNIALGLPAACAEATVRRSWQGGRVSLEVQRLALDVLAPFRDEGQSVTARRAIYKDIAKAHPDLGLPPDQAIAPLRAAVETWEQSNPDRCELTWVPARSVGALQERLTVIRIPAVRETAADMREGRGTALSALLAVLATDDRSAGPMENLRDETQTRYEAEVAPLQQARLEDLERDFTAEIQRFIPGAEVKMQITTAVVSIPTPGVAIRAGQGAEVTDVALQGHGFQRALLMAALQLVAQTALTDRDQPSVLLAVDEPELFQHPTMARHMGDLLARVAERADGRFQVAYTTHSPLLVDPHHFERIRVFRRTGSARSVRAASQADVTARLDALGKGPATRNVARAIDAGFAEAFFASAVLLCEGSTDVAAIRGAADRARIDLDANGIVAVASGKGSLPLRYAVLEALGIPAFVVFDGDAGCKPEARDLHAALNLTLLTMTGAKPVDFPPTTVGTRHACFEKNIDVYLTSQKDYAKRFAEIAVEAGDVERDDALQTRRQAVSDFHFDELRAIVGGVLELASAK